MSSEIIAIAAPGFDAPSETFIRHHVYTLAPGKTILLCEGRVDEQPFGNSSWKGIPILTDINPWRPPRGLGERVVNVVCHRWQTYVNPALIGERRRRVTAFLKAHGATALLAEYGPTGCRLMGACQEARVPLYVHFHGYDASILLRNPHQIRHYRKLFRICSGIITPSRFLANKLAEIGCASNKLHVVPCGVDLNRFRPSSRDPGRILAVGRLVEKKAPHLTIQAFARIASWFPDARLDIIGDGPLRERCQQLVAETGLSQRVTLHGVVPSESVATHMQIASLFVQHSVTANNGDTEGLPVAILEAMASALPVVSTRHSGIPEAVEHGVTGLLVPEGDVSAMAEAMAELLTDRARAAGMGAAGRQRVLDHFTIEHTRDRLRAIMGLSTVATAVAAEEPV